MDREQIIEHYKGFFGIDRVTTEADLVLIDWAEALLQEQKPTVIGLTSEEYSKTVALLYDLDRAENELVKILSEKTNNDRRRELDNELIRWKNKLAKQTKWQYRRVDKKCYDGSGVDLNKIDEQ